MPATVNEPPASATRLADAACPSGRPPSPRPRDAGDDDEPPVGELVRIEAEDERPADDEQLHLRDRRDARVARRPSPRATPAAASA